MRNQPKHVKDAQQRVIEAVMEVQSSVNTFLESLTENEVDFHWGKESDEPSEDLQHDALRLGAACQDLAAARTIQGVPDGT